MKILIIGGHGTIGRHVAQALQSTDEVITGGRSKGDVHIDLSKSETIEEAYRELPDLDAVICVAGEAKWAPFAEMDYADYEIGLKSKLMGQVELVRLGTRMLGPEASFTLSTGILADDPVPMTTSSAMVNGAIHSFVLAASLEMPHRQRINVVCSGLVEDSVDKYAAYFPGHDPVPMSRVTNAYIKCLRIPINGKIVRVGF
ncbi:short chain dehydrogenase [Pontibacter sp. G13]|uniref:short chain dehydrogenase n=1 Tax=Pontibacter sp. G13 TaxID=3074898 RepID=UPI00288A6741|nr:short chain dehydrogenase [Pontibacter sp. G13]WNJ19016.1 short chain dehydrogenase [Pontibacter sp. G13]